jgi:hypothetical protein
MFQPPKEGLWRPRQAGPPCCVTHRSRRAAFGKIRSGPVKLPTKVLWPVPFRDIRMDRVT